MKTLPTLFLCIAGALSGAGLGWLLRGAPARADSPDNPTAAEQTENSAARKSRPGLVSKAAASKAGEELTAALTHQRGALRWLTLLGAAEKATAAEMPGLLRAASGLPGAVKMLAVHWAHLDPQHMFRTLCAAGGSGLGEAGNYLFEEWTKSDPEAAIAALTGSGVPRAALSLRYDVIESVMKSDPARGLQLMSQWGTKHIPTMTSLITWAERSPQAAAAAVIAARLGAPSAYAMKAIGKAWAASDPAAALRFATEKGGRAGASLAQTVIGEWGQRDLKAAIACVGSLTDNRARGQLGPPLVAAWAKTDPRAALVWANENLTGAARSAATGDIVKTMAATDRAGAAEFLATLPPGPERLSALNRFTEAWLGDDRFNRGDKAEATAALTWLSSLPDADERERTMEQAAWRLMYRAPDETVAFLSTPQGANAPQQLFDQAARHLAQKNPDTAMQWAAALPPEHRAEARAGVLGEWIASRPEAAQAWVRAQPAGDDRTRHIAAVTRQLAWQSPDTTRRWLESLPAADRPAAREGLQGNGSLSAANRAALEALVK